MPQITQLEKRVRVSDELPVEGAWEPRQGRWCLI